MSIDKTSRWVLAAGIFIVSVAPVHANDENQSDRPNAQKQDSSDPADLRPTIEHQKSEIESLCKNEAAKQELLDANEELRRKLLSLEDYYHRTSELNAQLARQARELSERLENCSENVQTRSATATVQTMRVRTLSREEYLVLQQEIQQESRQFTTISNTMKTRHDAAKSIINNMR